MLRYNPDKICERLPDHEKRKQMNAFWHQTLQSKSLRSEDFLLNLIRLQSATDDQLTVYYALNEVFIDYSSVSFPSLCSNVINLVTDYVDEHKKADEVALKESITKTGFRLWDPNGSFNDFLHWQQEFIAFEFNTFAVSASQRLQARDFLPGETWGSLDHDATSPLNAKLEWYRNLSLFAMCMYIILAPLIHLYRYEPLSISIFSNFLLLIVIISETDALKTSILNICLLFAFAQSFGVSTFGASFISILRPIRIALIGTHDLLIK